MKYSELIDLIGNMNSGMKPALLTEAIEKNDNETALGLINNKTLYHKLYRMGFYIMNGGRSLLDKGWGGTRSPLQRAAYEGNHEVVLALIKAGAKVDNKNYLQWTPLHDSLSSNHDEITITLINAGANVNAQFRSCSATSFDEEKYFFPLHVAVRKNVGLPVIQLLIEKGADLNLSDRYISILMDAVNFIPDEDFEKIEFLLRQGANPNVVGYSYSKNYARNLYTPLFLALDAGKYAIATLLLRHNANVYEPYPRQWRKFPIDYILKPEMITIAIQLCRDNGLPLPVEPPRPVERVHPAAILYVHGTPTRNKTNETGTHGVSVHKTVSLSAVKLLKAYGHLNSDEQNMTIFSDLLSETENLNVIQLLIRHAAKGPSSVATHEQITNAVLGLEKKVWQSKFVDDRHEHGSKVKLPDLLSLILKGINSLPEAKLQKDALPKLCENMYFSQVEQICESGIFNNLVYSQQSILPEVEVLIHNKADAADTLSFKLHDFARKIYAENAFADHLKFEESVKESANAEKCREIMRDLFSEYFLIFGLQNSSEALTLPDEKLDALCLEFVGHVTKDIFEALEFTSIFTLLHDASKAKTQLTPV